VVSLATPLALAEGSYPHMQPRSIPPESGGTILCMYFYVVCGSRMQLHAAIICSAAQLAKAMEGEHAGQVTVSSSKPARFWSAICM
jgi:hypothetical protein